MYLFQNQKSDAVGVITQKYKQLVYTDLGVFESYDSIKDIKRKIKKKKSL